MNAIHLHCLHRIEKQYGLARQWDIGTRLQAFHSDEDVVPPESIGQESDTQADLRNEELVPGDFYSPFCTSQSNCFLESPTLGAPVDVQDEEPVPGKIHVPSHACV